MVDGGGEGVLAFPDDLLVGGDLLDAVLPGEEDIAVREDEAATGAAFVFPEGGSVLADDGGLASEGEVGVGDGGLLGE